MVSAGTRKGGRHQVGEAATASATQASRFRSRRFHRLSDRCLLVHPGLGTDPLTARAALLHRRRAAQGTRQAAAAARATPATRAFVGGPAGATRQCAALTAHVALEVLEHFIIVGQGQGWRPFFLELASRHKPPSVCWLRQHGSWRRLALRARRRWRGRCAPGACG